MNRRDRRDAVKKLREKGYSKSTAEAVVSLLRDYDYSPPGNFSDGDRVTLNVRQIRNGRDWKDMNPLYKAFVEESAGRVFTVRMEKPCLATFEEDDTWWFYTGDLIHCAEDAADG